MNLRPFRHVRRRWIVCALVVLGLWLASRIDRAASERPIGGVHPDVVRWGDVPIRSILRREKDVLVVNQFGMFRCSLSDPQHRWQPVPVPLTIPFSGRFADHPPGTRDIYYCVGYPSNYKLRSLVRGQGLYVSHDDGGTWQHVCDRGDFNGLIVCTGGHLYAHIEKSVVAAAAAATQASMPFQFQALASRDDGRTWSDITPPNSGGSLLATQRDPVNPSLIYWDSRFNPAARTSPPTIASSGPRRAKRSRCCVTTPARRSGRRAPSIGAQRASWVPRCETSSTCRLASGPGSASSASSPPPPLTASR
jgi:hypothetical protein